MKKLFIISALVIGYSVSGMCQSTTETTEQITVISKELLKDSTIVYQFRGMSGQVYESLPSVAQFQIGEVTRAKEIKSGAMDDIPAGKTIVENERTGLLFLKGK